MATVLVVYHSQSGNTEAAAQTVAGGAAEVEDNEVVCRPAAEATADDLISCGAAAFGSGNYFSYMAGALKEFFDRTFYPSYGKVDGKPCGIFLTYGGSTDAAESIKHICETFKFSEINQPVLVQNAPDEMANAELRELGKALSRKAHARQG